MNLVTDTHVLGWYTSGQLRRLSGRARRAFAEAEAGRWTIRVPTVVLMEIVLLDERGRRVAYRELREQLALRSGLPIEPLTPEDIDEARALRSLRDPFDRLIAGTARRLALPLLPTTHRRTGSVYRAAVGRTPRASDASY